MSKSPSVSIGLPVYNGENFISTAIDSILNQTYDDFELIITDNGSTDSTQQICRRYAGLDRRITYHRNETNLGAAPNFNRTLELSSGAYFKWMAHDDTIAPVFIERAVEILERIPSVVVCSTNVGIIDDTGKLIDIYDINLDTGAHLPSERFRSLVLDWHMCFEVFGLIRTEVLKQTSGMGNYSHGDGVLLTQLAMLGRFYKIEDILFFARRHAKQSMNMYSNDLARGDIDYHAYAQWFDAKNDSKYAIPQWRILKEYHRSILETDMTWTEKAKCHYYLLRWIVRNRNRLRNDLMIAARTVANRRSGTFRQSASPKI